MSGDVCTQSSSVVFVSVTLCLAAPPASRTPSPHTTECHPCRSLPAPSRTPARSVHAQARKQEKRRQPPYRAEGRRTRIARDFQLAPPDRSLCLIRAVLGVRRRRHRRRLRFAPAAPCAPHAQTRQPWGRATTKGCSGTQGAPRRRPPLPASGDESGDGPSVFRRSALTFESRSAAFSRHDSERSLGSLRATNH